MKYLYLAEKPSAMKDVKAAYNASSKPLGDIDFFALTGHICRLCEPKEYEDWDVASMNFDFKLSLLDNTRKMDFTVPLPPQISEPKPVKEIIEKSEPKKVIEPEEPKSRNDGYDFW